MIKEQRIESQSPEAIAYRNMNRVIVNKLFTRKDNEKNKKNKSELDYKARQLWRKIIIHSNTL
jgi:hypothetical protein